MMRSIARAALLVVCAGTVAQAQLGSILKKAVEKKVESKVENKVAPDQGAAPPLAGDPVTAPQLDGILKGLAVELEARDAASAKQKEWEAKSDEWRAADNAARPEETANRNARSKIQSCMYPVMQKLKDDHEKAIQERMMHLGADPKAQEWVKQYSAAAQKMAAAQQARDTAALRKAEVEWNKLLGMDEKADSAVAFKTCGRPPEPTAAMVKAAKLRKEMDALQDEQRTLETSRANKAAAAAGLSVDLYGTARERLLTWYQQQKYKERISVTKDEVALFSSRLAEIKKFEKALQ